ncbi:MAG: hypothetical protein WA139_03765 [Candidatus Aenigmatarchaeota archaeon]
MGYCFRCGRLAEDKIIGYNTQTGELIRIASPCGDCSEKISKSVAAFNRKGYERGLKEIRDMRSADMIDTGTAEFMKKRLKERHDIKEYWE